LSAIERAYTFTDNLPISGTELDTEIGVIYDAWNNHDAGTSAWTLLKLGSDPSGSPIASTLYKSNIIKVWAHVDGSGTAAIVDSFNTSGFNDDGTGDYTITIDTDFEDLNYGIVASGQWAGNAGIDSTAAAAGTVTIASFDISTGNKADNDRIGVICAGDQ